MTRDLKEIIDSRTDLLAEKKRLKSSIKMRKADIRDSFTGIRDELNPLSLFSRNISGNSLSKGILSMAGNSPLVSLGVSTAANFLLKKFLLRRAGFLPRIILPVVIKKVSDLIIAPKLNDKIVTGIRTVADKIRETDVENVLPDTKIFIPEKALAAVAAKSDQIADTLYHTADRIRPNKINDGPSYTVRKTNPTNKIAIRLRKLADRIRR